MVADECLCFPGEVSSQVILIRRCFDLYLAVPVDGIRNDVVAIEHAVERVKPSIIGAMAGLVAKVPLTHHAGAVSPAT